MTPFHQGGRCSSTPSSSLHGKVSILSIVHFHTSFLSGCIRVEIKKILRPTIGRRICFVMPPKFVLSNTLIQTLPCLFPLITLELRHKLLVYTFACASIRPIHIESFIGFPPSPTLYEIICLCYFS